MPAPENPDLELQRGSICSMNGRRAGAFEYRSHDRRLTRYVIPSAPSSPVGRAPADDLRRRASRPPLPAISEERRPAVATWWEARHQHALAGGVSADEPRCPTALWTSPVERP